MKVKKKVTQLNQRRRFNIYISYLSNENNLCSLTYIRNKVFLIISEVISCADYRLTKIADKTIMVENGWIFDPDLLHQIDFDDQCGNDTMIEFYKGGDWIPKW